MTNYRIGPHRTRLVARVWRYINLIITITITGSAKTKTKTISVKTKTKTKSEVFETKTKTKTANGSMKQNAHSSRKNLEKNASVYLANPVVVPRVSVITSLHVLHFAFHLFVVLFTVNSL